MTANPIPQEIRNMLATLAKATRELGGSILNSLYARDLSPHRTALQKAVAERPKLVEELARLTAERDAIAAKVEAGELTKLAMSKIGADCELLRRAIDKLDNEAQHALINTCTDDVLRREYESIRRARSTCLRRRSTVQQAKASVLERVRHAQEYLDLRAATLAENPKHPQAVREHRRAAEEMESVTHELAEVEADLAEVDAQFANLDTELSDVKQRMRDS